MSWLSCEKTFQTSKIELDYQKHHKKPNWNKISKSFSCTTVSNALLRSRKMQQDFLLLLKFVSIWRKRFKIASFVECFLRKPNCWAGSKSNLSQKSKIRFKIMFSNTFDKLCKVAIICNCSKAFCLLFWNGIGILKNFGKIGL